MARPMFTPEELEELRRADAELDETFVQTMEEFKASSRRDREALRDRKDAERGKESDRHRAYYEANREKTLEKRRESYKETREKKGGIRKVLSGRPPGTAVRMEQGLLSGKSGRNLRKTKSLLPEKPRENQAAEPRIPQEETE